LTKAAKLNLVFFTAALILSLHTVPYELRVCVPAPDHGPDSPEALVAGTASTPYQYRILIPWLVRGLLTAHVIDPAQQMAAFAVIQVTALMLLAFVFRRYLSRFIADPAVSSVAALTLFAILPFNYFNLPYYPYDIPSVLFFTVGLLLIYEHKWLWFYPLFIAATLNRETSIFLTVAMLFVHFDRYPPRTLVLLAGSQIAIWAVIKAALWIVYQDNRWMGYGLYEFQLKVNLATILERPLKAVIALASWGCVWLAVVVWRARIRDADLKRTLWTVPVFIAGMLFAGFIIELRIYGEVLPIVLAAFWVAFLDIVMESSVRQRLATGLGRPASG
jgi:hypothetical protein